MSENKSKKQKTKKLGRESLKQAALHYLGRFETTEARLRDMLERKLARRAMREGAGMAREPDPETAQWVEETISYCKALGLVDNERYGDMRLAGLQRCGMGMRRIKQDLRHRGLSEPEVMAVLDKVEDPEAAGWQAALRFAQKRRFGPFRRGRHAELWKADRARQRTREIAAFVRAGHDAERARRIVDAATLDALPYDGDLGALSLGF